MKLNQAVKTIAETHANWENNRILGLIKHKTMDMDIAQAVRRIMWVRDNAHTSLNIKDLDQKTMSLNGNPFTGIAGNYPFYVIENGVILYSVSAPSVAPCCCDGGKDGYAYIFREDKTIVECYKDGELSSRDVILNGWVYFKQKYATPLA